MNGSVPEKAQPRLRITGPAQRDIAAIAKWTIRKFGETATLRYMALIRQALLDIGANPERPGSRSRPEILVAGARTYHISFSQSSGGDLRVKEPRHLLLYRQGVDGIVDVARVLHDGRDFERHLPKDYRSR